MQYGYCLIDWAKAEPAIPDPPTATAKATIAEATIAET